MSSAAKNELSSHSYLLTLRVSNKMLSCVMATCRPVATAGQPARSAGSCKPVRGMKPLLRGERMVSFAAKEDKDDKFWGKGLSPDQVAFLARKCVYISAACHGGWLSTTSLTSLGITHREKFARGEGPVMPVESQCTRCKGEGAASAGQPEPRVHHSTGRCGRHFPSAQWPVASKRPRPGIRARPQGPASARAATAQGSTRRTRTWAAR